MTNARSGKGSPIAPGARRQHQKTKQDGNPRDHLAPLIGRAGEVELDRPRSVWELDSYERIISTTDRRWLAVDRGFPTRIVVLRYNKGCSRRGGRTEIDPDLPWLVMADARCHCNWSW